MVPLILTDAMNFSIYHIFNFRQKQKCQHCQLCVLRENSNTFLYKYNTFFHNANMNINSRRTAAGLLDHSISILHYKTISLCFQKPRNVFGLCNRPLESVVVESESGTYHGYCYNMGWTFYSGRGSAPLFPANENITWRNLLDGVFRIWIFQWIEWIQRKEKP